MNRTVLSLAVVLMLAVVAFAGVTEEVVNENSSHPGKCYDAKRNAGYAVGAKWHRIKEPCTELTCARHREPNKYIIKKTTHAVIFQRQHTHPKMIHVRELPNVQRRDRL